MTRPEHNPAEPGMVTDPLAFAKDIDVWGISVGPAVVILLFVFGVWVYINGRAARGFTAPSGGLNYVTGPMGSGKSMFGVREIVNALCEGKYVVTNVRLLPGWEDKVAAKKFPRRKKEAAARGLKRLYIYEPRLKQAMRYRLPCAKCGRDVKECGHTGAFQEGRGLMVWDESHNDLNNRDWDAGTISEREARALEKKIKARLITWGTQLRKLGYVGYLLSQHHENTDAQLRRICNHLIQLQNQRNRGGFGALLPRRLTMFLVYWYPTHLADGTRNAQAVKWERYFLPWTRNLYDSWETYHGIDDEEPVGGEDLSPIQLPGAPSLTAGATPKAGEAVA